MDEGLKFEAFLNQTLGRADAAMDELIHQSASLGMGPPVIAKETPQKAESKVIHAVSVLASHHRGSQYVENQLNRLQASWPVRILGAQGVRPGRWIWGLWEMGWARRLGTRFLERAILDRARIMVLPKAHPARVSFDAAADRRGTWAGDVKSMMARIAGLTGQPLPDIDQEGGEAAPLSREARRAEVRDYKWKILRPVLVEYEGAKSRRTHRSASSEAARTNRWQNEGPVAHGAAMLEGESKSSDWHHYKLWSLTRLVDGFPFPVWGLGEAARADPRCAWCGKRSATLAHVVVSCRGSDRAWERAIGPPGRPSCPSGPRAEEILRNLLEDSAEKTEVVEKVRVVGEVLSEYFRAKAAEGPGNRDGHEEE